MTQQSTVFQNSGAVTVLGPFRHVFDVVLQVSSLTSIESIMGTGLITNILQNTLFYVPQKKVIKV